MEGTLAKTILSEPEEITTMIGQKLPLKMSVDYISFSAHTDYQQTSEFIRILKPPHVVSLIIKFVYPLHAIKASIAFNVSSLLLMAVPQYPDISMVFLSR